MPNFESLPLYNTVCVGIFLAVCLTLSLPPSLLSPPPPLTSIELKAGEVVIGPVLLLHRGLCNTQKPELTEKRKTAPFDNPSGGGGGERGGGGGGFAL